MAEIKFCGMVRGEDARAAASLGARYIGVVLAGGPRALGDAAAADVLAQVPAGVARVAVFGDVDAAVIADRATRLGIDVAQLHGDPDTDAIAQVRRRWSGQVWAVHRVAGTDLSPTVADLFDVADGVVLDARVPGKLGGSGVALPWTELRAAVARVRGRRAKLILAGGLRAENVAEAIDILQPDVVDVSSGVEASVGVKDHTRMRAFRDAAIRVAAS